MMYQEEKKMKMDEERDPTVIKNTKEAIYFNFSYSALKLLGKNLYNNAASAISELVANGLDAGAKRIYVYIDMSDKKHSVVEILDDGMGMDYDDLAKKYVWVGRNRREDCDKNGEKQVVMGRKGIGKLAALYLSNKFSIITKKVGVSELNQWSVDLLGYKDSEFPRMDLAKKNISFVNRQLWEDFGHGTAIIMGDVDLTRNGPKRIESLKKVFADFYLLEDLTTKIYVAVRTNPDDEVVFEPVKKSIAFGNLFSIYDNTGKNLPERMQKSIRFTWASRYEHIQKIERSTKIWNADGFKYKGKKAFKTESGKTIEKEYLLKGWIGIHATIEMKNALDNRFIRNDVYQPTKLRLYVRNKLAVENYFDMHPSTQAMSNYIEGDISFDILDDDDLPDIATSSRQDFLDDERIDLLISLVDPIINALIKTRNEVGKAINIENASYEEESVKKEEEKRRQEETARRKAEVKAHEEEQKRITAETEREIAIQDRLIAEKGRERAERRVEKEQRRSEYILNVSKIDDKNTMSAMHNIYNTSVRIKNYLDDLSSVLELDEKEMKKYLKIVESNQKNLSVSKMISKSGVIADNNDALKRVNLGSFIDEYANKALALMYEKDELIINCNLIDEGVFFIKIKPLSFIMMIDNIVGNSIKAHSKKISIVDRFENGQYVVSFIDDGDGLSPLVESVDRLFSFGVTTTNGSGLGLYYSKKYMKSLNGDIKIESNSEKGVTVSLFFNMGGDKNAT